MLRSPDTGGVTFSYLRRRGVVGFGYRYKTEVCSGQFVRDGWW